MSVTAAELWRRNRDLADACLAHPFVQGISSGELPRERFQVYVAQDAFSSSPSSRPPGRPHDHAAAESGRCKATFQRFGVYGTSALTLVTAQNTLGVRRVHLLSPELVVAQIVAVAEDFEVRAAKTVFPWYNREHRHSRIAWLTPEMVHSGRASAVLDARADVLDAAYAARPKRFVRRPPSVPGFPPAVWINPPVRSDAFASSALFLVNYIYYHFSHGDTRFEGQGVARPIYFALLISHVLLSVLTFPMILTSFYLGLSNRLLMHRRLSRWTWAGWMYVSITGVGVYFMLHVIRW